MRFAFALPLVGILSLTLPAFATADSQGCSTLKSKLSDSVFYPNSSVYKDESTNFWSNTEIMSPACVFRPASAADLGRGIRLLTKKNAKFAVRGGGHMGIRGSNNIDNGVLIVMSFLDTLELSTDQSLLSVGPAYRWADVYSYLEPYNLAVAGGRLGPVGVPGLLLAGGINFYGNQVGFGCDTVVNYEVVLADGSVIEVNKDSYPDLFWALKGGSSNFGLVTRFDLQTIQSKKVWAGAYTVAEEYVDEFLKAIATYAADISDPKTHIVPALVPAPGTATLASAILFYDSEVTEYPEAFKPFTNIPAVANNLGFKTVAQFATELGGMVLDGINDVFVAGTVTGTTFDDLHRGISIINSTFFQRLPKLYSQVPAGNIHTIQLDWQPIGKLWMDASAKAGGNALGLDSSKVYLAYAEVVEWTGSKYNDIVMQWIEETTYAINNATFEAGLYDAFNYIGDAAAFQSIFPGYGPENHARLQAIAQKYDPNRVFQTLMPGGFKVY
ncbi:Putative FAD binding domain protein [Aspergillus calidoustus]|uniref:Putative FAD binding domain protein n=1 Tax=Aspergillus calidoustus TaxID=454130 RepID=A0A0U5GJ44_ASPCI|nr:Putative FAD binding domain protein [Aspergillus calidoustus]